MAPQKICVAVLAGGASCRMGKPKLLLPFNQTTLLDHALDTALQCSAHEACLITGAYHNAMSDHLAHTRNENLPFSIIHNPHWQKGQSTSVKTAADHALQHGCSALLILVADQPFVTASHLNALIAAYHQNNALSYIASNGQRQGNPCLFDKRIFDALLTLEGDEGARALFRNRPDIRPHKTHFDEPYLFEDVDTPDDLTRIEELMLCG